MNTNPNDAYETLMKAFDHLDSMDRPLIKRLRDRALNMEDTLQECLEYFRDNQDVVDGPDGQPAPDRCMRLANLIDETLR